ncbi:MAG TPA: NUDIX domain-containing protein [Candidatus Saccharimonadales bacterium]|nr:NUDIX domain-containing protein [Candidatus Saccharimonadales bacterium]
MVFPQLHRAQLSILRTLRHTTDARYTDLRAPTGLDSDVFKFHLRKLVHEGYVQQRPSGTYALTPRGKEHANNLDKTQRTVQKQPKLSMILMASRERNGATEYLFQQRLRNPFYGFWGLLSGPVHWGEAIETAAAHELQKQTGLVADGAVKGFCRTVDVNLGQEEILEDKLFALVELQNITGALQTDWVHGTNRWMTVEELEHAPHYFPSTSKHIDMVLRGRPYGTLTNAYGVDEY